MAGKQTPQRLQMGDPRLVVRWARRYARSRTISFLVQWVVIVTMVLAVGLAASLTNMAYRAGNMGLFWLSMVFMGLVVVALGWFSLSRWGGELIWRVTQWLYGEEGYAAVSSPADRQGLPLWLTALGGGLVVYHIVGAMLVARGYLAMGNMQPFSAAYMAPYLCVLILYQGLGLWAWIWPVLYGMHAVALLYGMPIRFPVAFPMLDMVVPVFGYGLIAILTGHVYSRYALWKLKSLTRTELPEFSSEDDPDSEDGGGTNG